MPQIVVLGAGIAGISVGYHANKIKKECVIYEAKERFGGLLDSFNISGFRFDNAVHLSFTNNSYVRNLFDQTPYIQHYPAAYNFENGTWLKHPVQNNLFPLSTQEKIEAIKSFIQRPPATDTDDYYEWLIQQYGEVIAKRFPCKYTRKYWTISPSHLSTKWIGNRMYRPTLDEVLLGAMTSETPNAYYAQEMRYPKIGGYRSFLTSLAKTCTIKVNKKAIYIQPKLKYIEFEDTERVYYENLISSIPLPELLTIIEGVPTEIQRIAQNLCATSIALVSIGFARPDVPNHLWFYIYDEDLLAARAYSPSLKSPDNVPTGCSSLQFEIYYSKYKPLNMNKNTLIEHVMRSLETMKIANKEDILITDYRIVPYANVIFDKEMIKIRKLIIDYLQNIGIEVVGRFGEWDYLWSDQSLLSGKKAIEKIFPDLLDNIL